MEPVSTDLPTPVIVEIVAEPTPEELVAQKKKAKDLAKIKKKLNKPNKFKVLADPLHRKMII